MTTSPLSPSTLGDIDPPPDIPTPSSQTGQHIAQYPRRQQIPSTFVFHSTPTLHHRTSQGSNVRFASTSSVPADSRPVQGQPGELQRLDPMQLCTSSEFSQSETQHDLPGSLPGFLPTPGREMHHLTTQLQGNWDCLFECQRSQVKAVNELTYKMKQMTSHTGGQMDALTAKTESNHQQLFSTLTATKQQEETETDQLIKAMKTMLTDKLQMTESTLCTEFRFMVEQLQLEVQQDIKTTQQILQKDQEQLSAEIARVNKKMEELDKKITELQFEMDNNFKAYGKIHVDTEKRSVSTSTTPHIISAPPVVSPAHLTAPAVKSDHLKLTFPTFGKTSDDPDPLLYLERCQDFLALHPLTDNDILETFRTVLFGTARDWWEVARTSITTWEEFGTTFLFAFLSEDYEDELSERVRTRNQGDRVNSRFCFRI